MKKRIIAIVLILMLAVSLLPSAAFADDEGIYISIGGKTFTQFGQSVSVGGGTAKLEWMDENPVLILTDVKLTQFTNLGNIDGLTCYAGIVYSGDVALEVKCTNCSITAPKHGDSDVYEGIYAEGAVRVIGDLRIKNVTIGAQCSDFHVRDAKLSIDSIGGCAIYSSAVFFECSDVALNTVGTNAVICDSFCSSGGSSYVNPDNGSAVINLHVDPSYGYMDAGAIMCSKDASINSDVTVNVDADYSGYNGDEPVLVAGVYSEGKVDLLLKATINMNVKCSENVVVEGAVANNLRCEGSDISLRMDLTGEHLGATGIDAENFAASGRIAIVMEGTQPNDTGLYAEMVKDYLVMDEVYIDLDCADAMAVCLPENCKFVNAVMSSEIINLHIPKAGRMENITDDSGENTFCTVTDASGKPANLIVLNRLPYSFNDIDEKSTDPYRNAILWAVGEGITNGYTPIEFRPSAPCTRGQVVTFLWRAKGSPEPTISKNPFEDVDTSSPYYKAILWAYENGITTGFDANHFKPSEPCTRAQVVTFLWRTEGKPAPESNVNPFVDVSASGSTKPYYQAILWAAENSITSGYGNNDFRPDTTCNRGQIVTFIYRDMVERLIGKIIDTAIAVNPDNPGEKPIKVYEESWYTKKTVPVNVTAKYSGGNEKTITLIASYDNAAGTEPVPENFIEVVGYGTTQNTVILKVKGNSSTALINVNFDENSAKLIGEPLSNDSIKFSGRYCAFPNDSLFVYDMYKDILMQVCIDVCTNISADDYTIVGNTAYVKENVYPGSVTVYKADITNVTDAGVYRGYQCYAENIGSYDKVQNLTFDNTGYTLTRTVNGKNVTTHYDFP